MTYNIESNTLFFEIERTSIIDISVGDTLQPKGFSKCEYIWSDQDAQFLESNPDARIFLKVKRNDGDSYKGVGIMVIPD